MAVLEICANSFQSAVNAEQGGAHRIELCQNLEQGGITPSIGLIRKTKHTLKIPVHVLIRPRIGDFIYSEDEFDIIREDMLACKQLGCEGVVIGILTPDSRVDVLRVSQLVQIAEPMSITFHRAFDDCHDQFQALEDVVETGCSRILTSGGAADAVEGGSRIAQLIEAAKGRVVVMPGAGIATHNLKNLIRTTAAVEFHTSAKISISALGTSMFKSTQLQTDVDQVRSLIDILNTVKPN